MIQTRRAFGAAPTIYKLFLAFLILIIKPACAKNVSGDVSGEWTPVDNPFVASGDCHVPAGSTLTLRPGVRLLLSPGASLVVDGVFNVRGNSALPVVIGPFDPATGPWRNILVTPTGQVSLSSCAVRGGGAVLPTEVSGMVCAQGPALVPGQLSLSSCEISGSASSGVFVSGGSLTVARSTFFGNGGAQPIDAAIHVATGSVALGKGPDSNSIVGVVFAVYNEDVAPVDASGQWWGSSTGPQSPENIPGIGSSVSDDVVFDNWVNVSPNPAPGDLDRDGSITVSDVAILLRVAAGMNASDPVTNMLGDVVPDGVLDIRDVVRLVRVAAGLETL